MGLNTANSFLFRHRPVVLWTVCGTLGAVAVSLAAGGILNTIAPASTASREAALALVASVLVAAPLAFACGLMASKAAALRKQVQRLGQSDSVTSCLNETTFSALVDTYSNRRSSNENDPVGTILLINLDDLKVVNARFGYTWGNEALSSMAAAIKGTVRNGDIVGRISGDRFGVFLPGTSETDARNVAERIRNSVERLQFYPAGTHFPLSVHAGAVIVSDKIGFDDLMRQAEDTLAVAETAGSNWIEYAYPGGSAPAGQSKSLQ